MDVTNNAAAASSLGNLLSPPKLGPAIELGMVRNAHTIEIESSRRIQEAWLPGQYTPPIGRRCEFSFFYEVVDQGDVLYRVVRADPLGIRAEVLVRSGTDNTFSLQRVDASNVIARFRVLVPASAVGKGLLVYSVAFNLHYFPNADPFGPVHRGTVT